MITQSIISFKDYLYSNEDNQEPKEIQIFTNRSELDNNSAYAFCAYEQVKIIHTLIS